MPRSWKKRKSCRKSRKNRKKKGGDDEKAILELLGDSILDNAYWNDVEKDTTAEVLRTICPVTVVDRTTEEITSTGLLKALKNNEGVKVLQHYVKARKEKGIPYEGKKKGKNFLVHPVPHAEHAWWNTDKEFRYVVLSVGGNDVVLDHQIDLDVIVNRIGEIIDEIIKKLAVEPSHVAYLIPYPPNDSVKNILNSFVRADAFYREMITKASHMCKEKGIECISLEDFTNDDRNNDGIPEPTKQGAAKIAQRIKDFLLYKSLLKKQEKNLEDALEDLKTNETKTEHWAWWAFPTELPGASEPGEKSAISKRYANDLLKKAPPAWKKILHKICTLLEEKSFEEILPNNDDRGRVGHFVKFWRRVNNNNNNPKWMNHFLEKIGHEFDTKCVLVQD